MTSQESEEDAIFWNTFRLKCHLTWFWSYLVTACVLEEYKDNSETFTSPPCNSLNVTARIKDIWVCCIDDHNRVCQMSHVNDILAIKRKKMN